MARFHSKKFWLFLSYGLKYCIATIWYIPLFAFAGQIFLNLDPFSYTFPKLIPSSLFCYETSPTNETNTCETVYSAIILIFRALCVLNCNVEACRFYAWYIFVFIYQLELQISTLEILSAQVSLCKCRGQKDLKYYHNFFKWYAGFRIASETHSKTINSLVAIAMGGVFLTLVLANLACIRCYGFLPFTLYFIMPQITILFSIFGFIVLKASIVVNAESGKLKCKLAEIYSIKSRELIVENKGTCALERKIIKRKLINFCKVSWKCGPFFELEQGAEVNFFFDVLNRTSDGVLLPIWN